MQKHLYIEFVQSADINMKSKLVIFFTLMCYAGSAQINPGYPYKPKFKKLVFEDITKNSIKKSSRLIDFKAQGKFNQPAFYKDSFSYFAIRNKSYFDSIKIGAYRFISSSDAIYPNYPDGSFWLADEEPIGRNMVVDSKGEWQAMNNPLPLYAVEEKSFYFQHLNLPYDTICKDIVYPSILNIVYPTKLEDFLLREFYEFDYSIKFPFSCKINIKFRDSAYVEVIPLKDGEDLVTKKIADASQQWAENNYLHYGNPVENRIYTYKDLHVLINKDSKDNTYYYSDEEWSTILREINEDEFKKLDKTYKIPPITHLKLNTLTTSFKFNDLDKEPVIIESKITKITLPMDSYKLFPLALIGKSHEKVFKVFKAKKNWIPAVTIGAMGAFVVSYLGRELAYNRYLALPQERSSAYKLANLFNKTILLSAIPYSIGVVFDIKKTVKGRNELQKQLKNNFEGKSKALHFYSKNDVQQFVDEEAEFPGGYQAMMAFIYKNLKYPETAIENNVQGKCYLRFVVSLSGTISNITVTKGVPDCPECDKAAIKVIEAMPNWKPGKLNGLIVSSHCPIPIIFAIE
jgi:TonB family protein